MTFFVLTDGCVDDGHHPRDEAPRGGRRQGAEPERAPGPDGGRVPDPEGPAGRVAEVQGDVRAPGAVAGRQPAEQRLVGVMAPGDCFPRVIFLGLTGSVSWRSWGGLSVFRWRVGMGRGVSVYTVSSCLLELAAGEVLLLGLVLFFFFHLGLRGTAFTRWLDFLPYGMGLGFRGSFWGSGQGMKSR